MRIKITNEKDRNIEKRKNREKLFTYFFYWKYKTVCLPNFNTDFRGRHTLGVILFLLSVSEEREKLPVGGRGEGYCVILSSLRIPARVREIALRPLKFELQGHPTYTHNIEDKYTVCVCNRVLTSASKYKIYKFFFYV